MNPSTMGSQLDLQYQVWVYYMGWSLNPTNKLLVNHIIFVPLVHPQAYLAMQVVIAVHRQ